MSAAPTNVLAILIAILVSAGCADPFIESTTILADTTDLVGPYSVATVAIGTSEADRLEIRHRTGDTDDSTTMRGDGDLFEGSIPAPEAAGEIAYCVLLISGDAIVDRDPGGDDTSDDCGGRFVFSVGP